MNLLLLKEKDFVAPELARIGGRRARHILNVLKASPGDQVKAGKLGGLTGTARLLKVNAVKDSLDLEIRLQKAPPPKIPLTLLLGLPRPKVLSRILQSAASLGVEHVALFHCYQVEKSYWRSPKLEPDSLERALRLGLEQSGDTVLPKVSLHRRFKPFVEDDLPNLCAGSRQWWVAHPYATQSLPTGLSEPTVLAIGPEGGFIEYEIELLQAHGFRTGRMGSRVLTVETSVASLIGRTMK